MSIKPHTDILIDDALGRAIHAAIDAYDPKTILEIGSSDGRGSTRVIIDKIRTTFAQLFCIEMDKERYDSLVQYVGMYPFVHCFNVPSVDVTGLMDRDYIEVFRKKHPDHLVWKIMDMDSIIEWHDNSILNILHHETPEGIQYIKERHNITHFDMVLIDGSPFTGMAELDRVHGADVIILDDTIDIKCYDVMQALLIDPDYTLVERDDTYRNGFAVFKHL